MLNLTQLQMLHTSIPIPHQWKREIKGSFDANLKKSIIEPVPIREPVEWCFHKSCCAIDMQKLNFLCYRETHHFQPLFQLACQISPNMKKSVLDGIDGFHATELDEASCKLITFISEWDDIAVAIYHKGCLAANDVCTWRLNGILHLTKSNVLMILLHDHGIEAAFKHIWDYLKLCCEKGIVFNKNKFQFC